MADAPAAEPPGRHEQALELRKEASTMALYVRGGGATRARASFYAVSVPVVAVAIARLKGGLAGH
jgi:hypothetical protein